MAQSAANRHVCLWKFDIHYMAYHVTFLFDGLTWHPLYSMTLVVCRPAAVSLTSELLAVHCDWVPLEG